MITEEDVQRLKVRRKINDSDLLRRLEQGPRLGACRT
jgi:hypothetical protein